MGDVLAHVFFFAPGWPDDFKKKTAVVAGLKMNIYTRKFFQ